MKIAPREKRREAACHLFSHARSRLARSTIPEEKWGTSRSLCPVKNSAVTFYLKFLVSGFIDIIRCAKKIQQKSLKQSRASESF